MAVFSGDKSLIERENIAWLCQARFFVDISFNGKYKQPFSTLRWRYEGEITYCYLLDSAEYQHVVNERSRLSIYLLPLVYSLRIKLSGTRINDIRPFCCPEEMSNKITNDEKALEKLREIAKIASIYHKDSVKFVRNKNLSHVVHAGLHIFQFVLIGCFVAAGLMLILGIIEMKHVDWYLDITLVTDEELLRHPIFIHNFVMCLMSIFCMSMYLIQGWILFDYYLWIKKQRKIDDSEVTDPETRTDTIEDQDRREETDRRSKTKEQETPGELDPIPTLDTFPSLKVSQTLSIDEEDVIFYCCFVDWYNYFKQKRQIQQPTHEFQVIHVM
ncbi:hypothetical protein WN51_06728 [Melipona quadrifasciata]|uniref:Uncharacterized protein n=1 Tax=Melipona quadrifasciata TaxID=166423 RepID=A0A0M8ZQN9_9HYME|nr:hypothetical protein WN51_06728 [Melipona quadrifasciata]